MSEIKLPAERRNSFGKGAARKIRRDHKIPAVLYGHGTDPVHIPLPAHDTALALKHANALLSIELEGKSQLALAKDCLLYTSPSPRDRTRSRMPSSA